MSKNRPLISPLVQHFWESGLLLVGFVALLMWDASIEPKVVLAVILIRVCFSWSEAKSINEHIASTSLQLLRRVAILEGFVVTLEHRISRLDIPLKDDDVMDLYADYEQRLQEFGEGFDQGLKERLAVENSALLRPFPSWFVPLLSILGALAQIAVVGAIAWAVTKLMVRI